MRSKATLGRAGDCDMRGLVGIRQKDVHTSYIDRTTNISMEHHAKREMHLLQYY